MFEAGSRYYDIEQAKFTEKSGRVIAYSKRRFLPNGREMQLAAEVSVTQGERLDLISARILGDPERFWQICDSNDAMNPDELTSRPGKVLRIAMPRM